jgi:hypothetical protein
MNEKQQSRPLEDIEKGLLLLQECLDKDWVEPAEAFRRMLALQIELVRSLRDSNKPEEV